MKKFYQLTSQDKQNAELYIYGDITSYKWFEDDVVAYDLAKELIDLNGKNLKVRINSYGGEVAQGLAIYNLLKDFLYPVQSHPYLRSLVLCLKSF